MNTIIVPFFNYSGVDRTSIEDLFRFTRHHEFADHTYIINSGEALSVSPGNATTIFTDSNSHWDNLDMFLPKILSELTDQDNILLIDCDTILYDKKKIDYWFSLLEHMPVVSSLDSSGGSNFNPFNGRFAENKNRGQVRRFTPYFFMAKAGFIRDVDTSFAPMGSGNMFADSMGMYTLNLLTRFNSTDESFIEVPDNRWTKYFNDGDFSQSNFSFEGKSLGNTPLDTGYYHVRNFGHGLRLRDTFNRSVEEFDELAKIMPQNELVRLLAWVEYISPSVPQELVEHIHIDFHMWKRYLGTYHALYPWLGQHAK